VRVVRFPLRMPAELAASARAELLDRGREPAGAAFRFGYLLGVELDELPELPALARLHGLLRERVVEPGYELSFFKTTVGQAPEAEEGVHFDGFHLDTHPDVRSDSDGFELARRGVRVPRADYQVVELPAEIEVRTIEIPPLEQDALYALAFCASVVPHVGVDGADGHFLASYEALRYRS
jgi:hypothetical protein